MVCSQPSFVLRTRNVPIRQFKVRRAAVVIWWEEDDKESQGCGIVFSLVAYRGQAGYWPWHSFVLTRRAQCYKHLSFARQDPHPGSEAATFESPCNHANTVLQLVHILSYFSSDMLHGKEICHKNCAQARRLEGISVHNPHVTGTMRSTPITKMHVEYRFEMYGDSEALYAE